MVKLTLNHTLFPAYSIFYYILYGYDIAGRKVDMSRRGRN